MKSLLSHPLIVTTALAFVVGGRTDSSYHVALRALFGDHQMHRFCVDRMDSHALVTFSISQTPGVLHRGSEAVQVTPEDSHPFRLFFCETVAVRPGRMAISNTAQALCLSPIDLSSGELDTDA